MEKLILFLMFVFVSCKTTSGDFCQVYHPPSGLTAEHREYLNENNQFDEILANYSYFITTCVN